MDFFTADQHFLHEPIIQMCHRPFKNNIQMTRALVKKWNEVVSEKDTVYVVGDFSMSNSSQKQQIEKIVERLNGVKHLILGNHDNMKPFDYIDIGFTSVHTSLQYKDYLIAHDPSTATVFTNKMWLVGHIHNLFRFCGNCFNVGVDVNNYTPISIEEIDQWIKEYKKSDKYKFWEESLCQH